MSEPGPVEKVFIRAVMSGVIAASVSGFIVGGVFVFFHLLGAEDKLSNIQVAVAVFLSSWVPWYNWAKQIDG